MKAEGTREGYVPAKAEGAPEKEPAPAEAVARIPSSVRSGSPLAEPGLVACAAMNRQHLAG